MVASSLTRSYLTTFWIDALFVVEKLIMEDYKEYKATEDKGPGSIYPVKIPKDLLNVQWELHVNLYQSSDFKKPHQLFVCTLPNSVLTSLCF